jgi:site-specific recombinase XerD
MAHNVIQLVAVAKLLPKNNKNYGSSKTTEIYTHVSTAILQKINLPI